MREKKGTVLKNIGIAVVCLCVLSYAVFHISSLFSEEIGVIVVGPITEEKSVSFDGYIFRDSTLINSSYSGAVDYAVFDGEKVAVGDPLATVYQEGNTANIRDVLSILDEQIALLKKSTDDKPSVSELSGLKASAADAYYAMMKDIASADLSSISSDKQKLLVSLNSIAMLTKEDFAITQMLDELTKKRQELLMAGGESEEITTSLSGYFYTGVDGFEESFSADAAKTLDAEGFRKIFSEPDFSAVANNCIGKMSYDSTWYFATEIDKYNSLYFSEGSAYKVNFTGGGGFAVNMTVDRILPSAETGGAVVVFKTNVIPEGFGFERKQTAKVTIDSVSGIYVPMSSVHRVNYENVVYILSGSVVQLRNIEIIYEGADYYIVKDGTGADEDKIYLKSNEQLVVSGSGLFDGRILD